MNTYTLYWRTGKREVVKGVDPAQAMTMVGYSSGAVRALDFYADGNDNGYTWDSKSRNWVRVQVHGFLGVASNLEQRECIK